MARHLGSLLTISPQHLKPPLGFVCVLQTNTSLPYLIHSTRIAIGLFLIAGPMGWNSDIWQVGLTVLNSFLRQCCLASTNVTSALEVS